MPEYPIESAYDAMRYRLAREGKSPYEKPDFAAADAAIDAMTNTELLIALSRAEISRI